jgi:hypothetical protein
MDSETVESASHPAPTSAAATASQPDADRPVALEQAGPDAWGLVACMTEAGEWPEPELLEQILAAGDAATLPLIDVLHSRPRGWPAEGLLYPVIGLLRMLRPRAAIPELVEILKCYKNETAEAAADALVDFGTPGFDALVELCHDPSIKGYQRGFVIEAAVRAVGDDLAKISRLAEVLRPILEDLIAKAREELRLNGSLAKHPPLDELLDDEDEEFNQLDEPDDDEIDEDLIDEHNDLGTESFDEDLISRQDDSEEDDFEEDDVVEPYIAEELAFVAGALADLGDEAAYDSIMSAFRQGLVDEAIVDQTYVDDSYGGGPEPPEPEPESDWLSSYREDYQTHIEERNPPPTPPRIDAPRPKYRYEDRYEEPEPPPDLPVTAPIRNTGPKVGRNDRCWCGSGKKFKKCHLGKDTLLEPDR